MKNYTGIRTLCALTALFAMSAFGQTFGEITGRVSDSSGAVVPGANITLTSVSTNATRTTVSTGAGDYTFPSVAPGFYNLKTEHEGFRTAQSNNIEVQVQQTVRLDIALQIGQVTESIEISAQADLLQAENASVGTVVENQAVNELPLNGREYLNLVALSANVQTLTATAGQAVSRQGGDRASQAISAVGQRIYFDYFTLDGVNNTDVNFNTYIVLPSIDAIQEFKVQTGVYPAEFGHEATQINVLTKSGGNAFHGALFEFVRNDVFDAIPYAFTAVHPNKAPFKWNDFGFELDGPVWIPKIYNGRNRLFFMANYESKQQRQHSQSYYSVPTPAMFTGNESQPGINTIYDPLTGLNGATKTPFPGNIIPSSRFDPTSLKFLPYYVSSILPGLANNYVQNISSPLARDGFVLRMDFVESAKSQWSGRYSWGSESQETTGLTIVGSKILTGYEQYLGTNTRSITPTLLNEARFGYSRFFNSLGTLTAYVTDSVTPTIASVVGVKPGAPSTWGVPNVTFSGDGFSGIGDNSDGPYVNSNNTSQFVDTMSWTHGKHSMRWGFEYNRQNYNQVGNQFSRGVFGFFPYATQSSANAGGDAWSDFLLGQIYQSRIAVSIATAVFQRNAEAAFFDDTWKINPKLTITLGLRYELTPPWTDHTGTDFTVAIPHILDVSQAPVSLQPYYVRQGNCTDVYAGLSIHWTSTPAVCSNGTMPNQLMRTDYTNWAPRVSMAYSPDSKTVFRVGFGRFFSQDIADAIFDMVRNIAAQVTPFATNGQGIPWSQSFPAGAGGSAIAQIPPPYAYVDSYDHRTPYSFQWLLNVQRQFGTNWTVEAGYMGSETHHNQGFQDANQAVPGTVGTAVSRLPWSDYGLIQLVQNGMNAVYHGGSVKLTRRFSQGVSVITSYTFSKSIDDSGGIRGQSNDVLGPQNDYCIKCERARSPFDVTQRFVVSTLYDLPVGKGKKANVTNAFLNAIVGGWQIGGIFTKQGGWPGTLSIGGVDNAETDDVGIGSNRPNFTGVNPYSGTRTTANWLNLGSFVEAPPGQFGNVGRNTIIGPGLANLDFEVHKQIIMPYNEHHSLQFRFEAFNVTNHPNWGMPQLNILAGGAQSGMPATDAHMGFGAITSTVTSMRQIQLGLKYSF